MVMVGVAVIAAVGAMVMVGVAVCRTVGMTVTVTEGVAVRVTVIVGVGVTAGMMTIVGVTSVPVVGVAGPGYVVVTTMVGGMGVSVSGAGYGVLVPAGVGDSGVTGTVLVAEGPGG
jgi:hypothetical protein